MSRSADQNLASSFDRRFADLVTSAEQFIPDLASMILQEARAARASDIHLTPGTAALDMHWRVDGVLHRIAGFEREIAGRLVARLKVLAGLLTYRTDIPQEGRVSRELFDGETRIATFPLLHGERAVVRLFADYGQLQRIEHLGMHQQSAAVLHEQLQNTSGVILICGPSGSGKTTTAYACLRELVSAAAGSRCVMTLEDPVEMAIPGVAQAQVKPAAGFDLSTGVRSLMRQDPDVILVGEVRDSDTAEAAFQAALTGHLVLTTFHAGTAVEAVTRLGEMNLEPALIRSVLRLVICQRLLRQSCPHCLKSDSSSTGMSAACQQCGGTGYHGRFLLTEELDPQHDVVAKAILNRVDSAALRNAAQDSGQADFQQAAAAAVAAGKTTAIEVFRVLGKTLLR